MAESLVEARCHCGEPAPIRGVGDPWEGRMDGYCYECSLTRCDTTDGVCSVKGRLDGAIEGTLREAVATPPELDYMNEEAGFWRSLWLVLRGRRLREWVTYLVTQEFDPEIDDTRETWTRVSA